VKRGKNAAADAEAICEAVTRPTMRFVGAKSPDQQATMMLHRVRKILTRQRTQISNALRAHMAEFGITAAIGRGGLDRLIAVIADQDDARLPDEARACLAVLSTQLEMVKEQILDNDRRILADIEPAVAASSRAPASDSSLALPSPISCRFPSRCTRTSQYAPLRLSTLRTSPSPSV